MADGIDEEIKDPSESENRDCTVDLKQFVPPFFYKNNETVQEIYNQQEKEIGKARCDCWDLINQCFIETATDWGLKIWEKDFGIKSLPTDSLDTRRSRLLAKKRGTGTTTVQVLKDICKIYADKSEVEEHTTEYWFGLVLEVVNHGFKGDLKGLYDTIHEIKPAHLEVRYFLKMTFSGEIGIASVGTLGEIINTFPWMESEITSKLEVPVAVVQKSSAEIGTVYPKDPIEGTLIQVKDNTVLINENNDYIEK